MGKNKIKPQVRVQDPQPEPELIREFAGEKRTDRPQKEKQAEAEPDPERLRREEARRIRKERLRSALDGSVVLDKGLQRYWDVILYVFVLAMLLISGNYISESVARECSDLKGELKELQFRQISSEAELMRISRQSSVADILSGTGVKESVVPPYIIYDRPEDEADIRKGKTGKKSRK